MWDILCLLVSLGSPISFVQRITRQIRGLDVPKASPWTTPHPAVQPPRLLMDAMLGQDVWRDVREDLDCDMWARDREVLALPSIKHVPYPLPGRKEFLLERFDGRESNDIRRDPVR